MKDKRILVVDDEDGIREIFVELMSLVGYENVVSADSVTHGLEILENQEIDIVFTDFHMPEMGAKEFVEEINQRFPENRPYIVVLTGEIDSSSNKELDQLRERVDGMLAKPFEEDDIIKSIEEVCSKSAS